MGAVIISPIWQFPQSLVTTKHNCFADEHIIDGPMPLAYFDWCENVWLQLHYGASYFSCVSLNLNAPIFSALFDW